MKSDSTSQESAALKSLISSIEKRAVDDADLGAIANLISDSVGCILGATKTPIGQSVLHWAAKTPESAQSWAFVLGALSNILELDAMHVPSSVHPGTVVVPAVLAIAITQHSSAHALLHATLQGTEVALRLGRSTGLQHRKLFQSTSSCAAAGAALACGHLLGLNQKENLNAVSNSISTAGGLWAFVDEETSTKQWHSGHASQCGVACAELAQHGFIGPQHVIDSPRGFHAIMCHDAVPAELERESIEWQVHGISYKPWPSPRPTHASITVALSAAARLKNMAIERVILRTFGFATNLCNHPSPTTSHHARFSLQHCVAAALTDHKIDFNSFDLDSIQRISHLTKRISVEEDANMSEFYPSQSHASIEIYLTDGTMIDESTPHALGDPEIPLSESELHDKISLIAEVSGATNPNTIGSTQEAIRRLDEGMISSIHNALTDVGIHFKPSTS